MKHAAFAIGAIVAVTGCGSAAPGALPIGIENLDSGTFHAGPDASTSDLAVSVAPGAPSVCPGQCVTLSASASGGQPPYAFAWSPEVGAERASVTVCPTATTSYGVTATDSSGSRGELQQASLVGSANVTVVVNRACSDGGALGDAGGDAASASAAPWTGCEDEASQNEDLDGGCTAPDDGGGALEWVVPLTNPLVRGQSYDITMALEVLVPPGPSPVLYVWGSTSTVACTPVQALTVQTLSVLPAVLSTATAHFCVTAQADTLALLAWAAAPNGGGLGSNTNPIPTTVCAVSSCSADP
jgi:hypothetical protein